MKEGKEILKAVLKQTGLTINALATALDMKRSQGLYDIESGKVKRLSTTLANKIKGRFPEFNTTFLLTGEGEMLKGDPPPASNQQSSAGQIALSPTLEAMLTNLMQQQNSLLKTQEIILQRQHVETNKRIDDVLSAQAEAEKNRVKADNATQKSITDLINLVQGDIRHSLLMTQALSMTNQDSLAKVLEKLKAGTIEKVSVQHNKDNLAFYKKLKDALDIH